MNLTQKPDSDLSPIGSLALLWPAIPDALVSPAARSRIEAAAGRLAPIARVALEVRLGEGQDAVDLHQFIHSDASDAAVLARYLAKAGPPTPGEETVRRFLDAWASDAGGVRTDLYGFFLEWDGPGSQSEAPPAIFLPLQDRHDPLEATASRERLSVHIERLGLAGNHVAELMRAIPGDLSISYVGFMLGRGSAVRLNLRGIRPDALAGVLTDLGWPGDHRRAVDIFAELVALTGRVAVALDFAPAIHPTIGFEASLPNFPGSEPRWREFLDYLSENGLCTQEKRAALEGLGAQLYPEKKWQDWPASWILAAVGAPRPWVPWYERRLSHVKVTIGADGVAGAKAYISAQHYWSRGDGAAEPSAPAPIASIEEAADRAAGFLFAEREQDDFWRDFRLVNGASDEWVTAFVGYALVTSGVHLPDGLVSQTISALLARQKAEGGWGYNSISPADADSTAWVLKFFRAVGYRGPEVERADRFLRSHFLPGGGISTYAADTKLLFGGVASRDDSGWRGSHVCVAANVASLIEKHLTDFLLSNQDPSGAWASHWWREDAFATALATGALAADDRARDALSRATEWAARRSGSTEPKAFDRAWLLLILARGNGMEREQALTMARALAAQQQADGAWDASAEMLFPDPAEVSRRSDMAIIRDDRRVFTAASALLALGWARDAGIHR